MMKLTLSESQDIAFKEILNSYENKKPNHLLTGFAGTGKTTLLQEVVRALFQRRARVAVTAPTNKAVHVLERKMKEAGLENASCLTIHQLLGLRPQNTDKPEKELKQINQPKAGSFNVVIIDECSLLSKELQKFIDHYLNMHFVLYVGDPAQLPPINEDEAPCFKLKNKSNLSTIIRQAESNPIIQASISLRERLNWEWCREKIVDQSGILPVNVQYAADVMKDVFTSKEFKKDNDLCRYLTYTNERAINVNKRVRHWLYGETDTPFVAGEPVITRKPIMTAGEKVAHSVNDEIVIESIIRTHDHVVNLPERVGKVTFKEETHSLKVWRITLTSGAQCLYPADLAQYNALSVRVKSQALVNGKRWLDWHSQINDPIADLRHVYAMTIHSSQGSTFDHVFIDVPDCKRFAKSDPDTLRKLLYVAVTRPRYLVMAVVTDLM
jgi:exodeoxyribonuclease V